MQGQAVLFLGADLSEVRMAMVLPLSGGHSTKGLLHIEARVREEKSPETCPDAAPSAEQAVFLPDELLASAPPPEDQDDVKDIKDVTDGKDVSDVNDVLDVTDVKDIQGQASPRSPAAEATQSQEASLDVATPVTEDLTLQRTTQKVPASHKVQDLIDLGDSAGVTMVPAARSITNKLPKDKMGEGFSIRAHRLISQGAVCQDLLPVSSKALAHQWQHQLSDLQSRTEGVHGLPAHGTGDPAKDMTWLMMGYNRLAQTYPALQRRGH